ncbi:hypothetical protein [Halanaeroarchaeum sulfurireducens]|uniref:hypothetical protein n=1 Tax=Halanaeroarchaeum sulfurireducens TaxID=1604004 RepID=UPI0006C90A51|nr:hypothetical protein [Halanaeroarchaeum sulfurireducens]
MSDEIDEPLDDLRREVESSDDREETDESGDDGDKTGRSDADGDETDGSGRGDESEETETEDIPEADEGPMGELRRDVESKADERKATDAREYFAEMDVGDVDTDEIWADLLFEDGEPTEGQFPASGTDEKAGQVVTQGLCHRCEYFGDPPQLHCTHEGTEIRELVDMSHYRVTNCPMVDQDVEE